MTSFQDIQANEGCLRRAHTISRALLHPLRMKMLELLQERGQVTVTEVFNALHLDQSCASSHLSALKEAGVIKAVKEGRFTRYCIDDDRVAAIIASLRGI